MGFTLKNLSKWNHSKRRHQKPIGRQCTRGRRIGQHAIEYIKNSIYRTCIFNLRRIPSYYAVGRKNEKNRHVLLRNVSLLEM